ncbi:hypothetical protein HYY70_01220 [Candidatus Woesearchaeota archaeon]|nr:hypothetical protein [Candidatus Woesearchaeota archaeon]
MGKKSVNWTKMGVFVAAVGVLVTFFINFYYGDKSPSVTLDNDLVDNKYSTNPTTIINSEKPDRVLTDLDISDLKKNLPSDKSKMINIFYTCGTESLQLAEQFKNYLENFNWKINFAAMQRVPPVVGVVYGGDPNPKVGLAILVGCES